MDFGQHSSVNNIVGKIQHLNGVLNNKDKQRKHLYNIKITIV